MSADANRAKSIFLAALDEPAGGRREAYLARACGEDVGLREEVDDLLAHHEQIGSFLDGTVDAHSTADTPSADHTPGAEIGPYKLVGVIGEGGMGTVYLARQQEPVKRLVALKVIKAGMDSKHVLARFEAERQALALMDHPHIAKVLDAGATDAGRPYFVMELVKGVPLTRFCDERRLTPRQRLELFVPVCHAVQHAHQKGIIHRDIKPSNVLVAQYDNRPVPKVIDFGVAKATGDQLTEKTLVTGLGAVVGTPEYMSPEQAELNQLDIDTRSDVYSLGVLLYELLTGTTPLQRKRIKEAPLLEVLRLVREEEPARPSARLGTTDDLSVIAANRGAEPKKLAGLVRGELDWIVMKCLEKDRSRRYETANSLALDLHRYLADEPVQACPPTVRYRLRKFARRHKGGLVTATVLAAGLLASVVALGIANVLVARERDEKAEALGQKDAALVKENAALEKTKMVASLAKVAFNDCFTVVSESTLLDKPGMQPLRKELLERARRYYHDLLAHEGADPHLEAEIAATYLRIFVIYLATGSDDAMAALRSALDIVERLVNDHPHDPEIAKRLGGFWKLERYLLKSTTSGPEASDLLEAERLLRRGIALWEKQMAVHPGVIGYQNDLAAFWTYLGDVAWDRGQKPEALRAYQTAVDIRERLVHEPNSTGEHRAALAESRNGLAWMLQGNRRLREAERLYRAAIELQEKVVREFPDVPHYRLQLASCCHNFSALMSVMPNGHKEAELLIRRALTIKQKLATDFPDMPSYMLDSARSYSHLGLVLARAKRPDEAESAYQQAIELMSQLQSRHPNRHDIGKELGWSSLALAELLEASGRAQDAEQAYGRVATEWQKFVREFPQYVNYRGRTADVCSRRVRILKEAGRAADAEKVAREFAEFYAELIAARPADAALQQEFDRISKQLGAKKD